MEDAEAIVGMRASAVYVYSRGSRLHPGTARADRRLK
jgi:hypothetical protein